MTITVYPGDSITYACSHAEVHGDERLITDDVKSVGLASGDDGEFYVTTKRGRMVHIALPRTRRVVTA